MVTTLTWKSITILTFQALTLTGSNYSIYNIDFDINTVTTLTLTPLFYTADLLNVNSYDADLIFIFLLEQLSVLHVFMPLTNNGKQL